MFVTKLNLADPSKPSGFTLIELLVAITIVGIPFAVAAFRIASFAAFPFGKELVDARAVGEDRILGTSLANLLWIILAGLWAADVSTASALLLGSATLASTDIIKRSFSPDLSPARDQLVCRVTVLALSVFTFLLASFPAGLVIYWTWNNLLSVIQQYVIMKRAGVAIGRKAGAT